MKNRLRYDFVEPTVLKGQIFITAYKPKAQFAERNTILKRLPEKQNLV
ncbi:MAG: hypothetical protein LBD59_11685 [Prevotellaceae bacterium]|nr:hypothetical protein [Prevotellaceae bacterium]